MDRSVCWRGILLSVCVAIDCETVEDWDNSPKAETDELVLLEILAVVTVCCWSQLIGVGGQRPLNYE